MSSPNTLNPEDILEAFRINSSEAVGIFHNDEYREALHSEFESQLMGAVTEGESLTAQRVVEIFLDASRTADMQVGYTEDRTGVRDAAYLVAGDILYSLGDVGVTEREAVIEWLNNEIGADLDFDPYAFREEIINAETPAEQIALLEELWSDELFEAGNVFRGEGAMPLWALGQLDDSAREAMGLPTHADLISEAPEELQAKVAQLEATRANLSNLRTALDTPHSFADPELIPLDLTPVHDVYERLYAELFWAFTEQEAHIQAAVAGELYISSDTNALLYISGLFANNSQAWHDEPFSAAIGTAEGFGEALGADVILSSIDYLHYGQLAPFAALFGGESIYEQLGLPQPSDQVRSAYHQVMNWLGVDREVADDAQFGGFVAGTFIDLFMMDRFWRLSLAGDGKSASNNVSLYMGGGDRDEDLYRHFPNLYPDDLSDELEVAERFGIRPISVDITSPETENVFNQGTIKWAVTESGELLIIPHSVDIGGEINHTVLTNGEPVLAAGEAEISMFGDNIFVTFINRHSGHYEPSEESLMLGVGMCQGFATTPVKRLGSICRDGWVDPHRIGRALGNRFPTHKALRMSFISSR